MEIGNTLIVDQNYVVQVKKRGLLPLSVAFFYCNLNYVSHGENLNYVAHEEKRGLHHLFIDFLTVIYNMLFMRRN